MKLFNVLALAMALFATAACETFIGEYGNLTPEGCAGAGILLEKAHNRLGDDPSRGERAVYDLLVVKTKADCSGVEIPLE